MELSQIPVPPGDHVDMLYIDQLRGLREQIEAEHETAKEALLVLDEAYRMKGAKCSELTEKLLAIDKMVAAFADSAAVNSL